MTHLHGLSVPFRHAPELDDSYIPVYPFLVAYEESAAPGKTVALVVRRRDGQTARRDIIVGGTQAEADVLYASLIADALLWQVGGPTLYVCGDEAIAAGLKERYSPAGAGSFDADFMGRQANRRPMAVISLPLEQAPASTASPLRVKEAAAGRSIGIDLGGSDIKYAATIDGEVVTSAEVVWHPKVKADPAYHFEWITKAIGLAAEALDGRVDYVSFSSAGVFDGNEVSVTSLFRVVPEDLVDQWRDLLPRAARAVCGPVPVTVVNDGDVSAFAGYVTQGHGEVLGLAFGTSLACGYADADGGLLGWPGEDGYVTFYNEMAFVIGNLHPAAALDVNWSNKPCYSQQLSQDAVVRLAMAGGIEFTSDDLAERLKETQALATAGDERALRVFRSVGTYLAHAVPHFHRIYDSRIEAILLLGRVMSGAGGEVILATANAVLAQEYPRIAQRVSLVLPDEEFRRKGQAVFASLLHP